MKFNVCYYLEWADVSAHLTSARLRGRVMAKKENSAWRGQRNWLPLALLEEETCDVLVLYLSHDFLAAGWCRSRTAYYGVMDKNTKIRSHEHSIKKGSLVLCPAQRFQR